MHRNLLLTIITLVLTTGCYKTLELEGFDKQKWTSHGNDCTNYRMEVVDHLLKNDSVLLESTQNEIESLLGRADEHELYERNQKFFHYRLSTPSNCAETDAISFLSLRFNAMGRVNLAQVMLREPEGN
ncbi:MAG: hypothetical protein AAF616_01530 [Bacteroidota bacterium]